MFFDYFSLTICGCSLIASGIAFMYTTVKQGKVTLLFILACLFGIVMTFIDMAHSMAYFHVAVVIIGFMSYSEQQCIVSLSMSGIYGLSALLSSYTTPLLIESLSILFSTFLFTKLIYKLSIEDYPKDDGKCECIIMILKCLLYSVTLSTPQTFVDGLVCILLTHLIGFKSIKELINGQK